MVPIADHLMTEIYISCCKSYAPQVNTILKSLLKHRWSIILLNLQKTNQDAHFVTYSLFTYIQ